MLYSLHTLLIKFCCYLIGKLLLIIFYEILHILSYSYTGDAINGYFPNISKRLLILAVLPVTTCTCERSFSTLKRIKTYSRQCITVPGF